MRKLRIQELPDVEREQFLYGIVPGKYIYTGGLTFEVPGSRTHSEGFHVHEDCEVFLILQGEGEIEINGEIVDKCRTGDVIIIEPGEDHHIISSVDNPIVLVWMHMGDKMHEGQRVR